MIEVWDDPYLGLQRGERCLSEHPTIPACQCMFKLWHTNDHQPGQTYHRYTSGADGRSVSWYTDNITGRTISADGKPVQP